MSKKVVAFLDLLGFRNFTKVDPEGALLLLENYQTKVLTRIINSTSNPPGCYEEIDYRRSEEEYGIDSFEDFLSFSDSLIITSNEPDKFVKQLSTFIKDCFLYSFQAPYAGEFLQKIIVQQGKVKKDGTLEKYEKETTFFPTLFRGGITFGEVCLLEKGAIINRKRVLRNST